MTKLDLCSAYIRLIFIENLLSLCTMCSKSTKMAYNVEVSIR